jgi:hypothetical protein
VFEGGVRRLLAPRYSVEIQIWRDLLPTLALGAYLLSGRMSHHLAWPPPAIGAALTVYILVGIVQL